MVVYIVTGRDYDSWYIEGVYVSREDAERKAQEKGAAFPQYNYDVEEQSVIDGRITLRSTQPPSVTACIVTDHP